MDTWRARHARMCELSSYQQEIVAGSMLGDGYLVATTRGFAFRVNHGLIQKEYVDWKYAALEQFTNSKPAVCQRSYYFRTVSHPFFDDLREQFYIEKRKIVPPNIEKWLTPLSLSVWIMDDGAREGNQLRLNTQCFSRKEHEYLSRILLTKLGIATTINRDKNLFRLRVRDISMAQLKKLTLPYIIPSMLYKLSL